jgi:excalibur calcium-binding domain-containing protein
MKKVILGILIGALGVFAWQRLHQPLGIVEETSDSVSPQDSPKAPEVPATEAIVRTQFRCDGRIYCSQMTSCEEAEFFLENCPGVKMDGGGDGVPCERQWCGNR